MAAILEISKLEGHNEVRFHRPISEMERGISEGICAKFHDFPQSAYYVDLYHRLVQAYSVIAVQVIAVHIKYIYIIFNTIQAAAGFQIKQNAYEICWCHLFTKKTAPMF